MSRLDRSTSNACSRPPVSARPPLVRDTRRHDQFSIVGIRPRVRRSCSSLGSLAGAAQVTAAPPPGETHASRMLTTFADGRRGRPRRSGVRAPAVAASGGGKFSIGGSNTTTRTTTLTNAYGAALDLRSRGGSTRSLKVQQRRRGHRAWQLRPGSTAGTARPSRRARRGSGDRHRHRPRLRLNDDGDDGPGRRRSHLPGRHAQLAGDGGAGRHRRRGPGSATRAGRGQHLDRRLAPPRRPPRRTSRTSRRAPAAGTRAATSRTATARPRPRRSSPRPRSQSAEGTRQR